MQNVASVPNPPPRPMVIPDGTKNLRACTKCHLLKTRDQFVNEGCNNCDYFDSDAPKRKREDIVDKNTTALFEGVVAMITPGNGWVSNWQGIPRLFTNNHDCCGTHTHTTKPTNQANQTGTYKPGAYALHVEERRTDVL